MTLALLFAAAGLYFGFQYGRSVEKRQASMRDVIARCEAEAWRVAEEARERHKALMAVGRDRSKLMNEITRVEGHRPPQQRGELWPRLRGVGPDYERDALVSRQGPHVEGVSVVATGGETMSDTEELFGGPSEDSWEERPDICEDCGEMLDDTGRIPVCYRCREEDRAEQITMNGELQGDD